MGRGGEGARSKSMSTRLQSERGRKGGNQPTNDYYYNNNKEGVRNPPMKKKEGRNVKLSNKKLCMCEYTSTLSLISTLCSVCMYVCMCACVRACLRIGI